MWFRPTHALSVLLACGVGCSSGERPLTDERQLTDDTEPADDTEPLNGPVEPVTLARFPENGRTNAMPEPARLLIESGDEWTATWARLVGDRELAPVRPEVDFQAAAVVLIALGERPTSGYSVDVSKAAFRDGSLRLTVLETQPGAGCGWTDATEQPVIVLRVPRFGGALEFDDVVEARSCAPPP
jgi:hypothetical protein